MHRSTPAFAQSRGFVQQFSRYFPLFRAFGQCMTMTSMGTENIIVISQTGTNSGWNLLLSFSRMQGADGNLLMNPLHEQFAHRLNGLRNRKNLCSSK